LFRGSPDPGISYPVFVPEDVLGVYLQGDTAIVNWRAGFLQKLKDMIETAPTQLPKGSRERMLIFGVINTLTDMQGIQRVWMLEDGRRIDDSAGTIYLGSPLNRSPGLMLEE